MPLFPKKEALKELSFEEKRQKAIKVEEAKIDKEYKKKLFMVKYLRIIVFGVIGLIIVIVLIFQGKSLYSFLKNLIVKPPVEEVVDLVEKPPADFKIETKDTTLLLNKSKNQYDIFTKLINKNPEWGVSELRYEVNLKDKSGEIVGKENGKTYILPGSTRSLILVNVSSEKPVSSLEITLDPVKVQKLKEFRNLDFSISNTRYFESDLKGRVSGTLKNATPYNFDQIDLNIILFNKKGEIVGVNFTNINAMLSNTTRDFIATWDKYQGTDVQVVVEPNVNVFHTETFLKTYQDGQELNY